MVSVVKIASYICQRYQKEFGERIDEMKLHKLLYFTQRECIVQTGEPLFEEPFSAWKYGPVVVGIRQLYKTDTLHDLPSDETIEKYKPVFDKVFEQYAPKSSLSLSALSHGDYSWQHARGGADRDERCDTYLDIHDIEKDAERIKMRRFMLKKLREIEEKEVLEAMKHVGCQYLFLFAADKTDDEELVAYYRDSLYFKEAVDVATAKPIYDLTCKFMYQETSKLVSEQAYFFDHYNVDSDEA